MHRKLLGNYTMTYFTVTQLVFIYFTSHIIFVYSVSFSQNKTHTEITFFIASPYFSFIPTDHRHFFAFIDHSFFCVWKEKHKTFFYFWQEALIFYEMCCFFLGVISFPLSYSKWKSQLIGKNCWEGTPFYRFYII